MFTLRLAKSITLLLAEGGQTAAGNVAIKSPNKMKDRLQR